MRSEEGEMTASLCRRRHPSSPMDVDDLLSEILLRLPPQPSSLPRASLVCSRWRRLVSDRRFLRRFRLHHRRTPPLLGCFFKSLEELCFQPTMDSPDRVSPPSLPGDVSPGSIGGDVFVHLGCRHGLALILYWRRLQVLVWDPVSGAQHWVALPPGFDMVDVPLHIHGAVLGAAADVRHFQVVLVGLESDIQQNLTRVVACVYSSETGGWGDLISTPLPSVHDMHGVPAMVFMCKPSVLVGDSLYWILVGNFAQMIEFDLEKLSLAVSVVPVDMLNMYGRINYQYSVMRADDGGLGFLNLLDFSAQVWKRKKDSDGIASWVLGRTIELDKLISLDLPKEMAPLKILGFAEENNVVFLLSATGVFMVQLDSLQSKKISENKSYCFYHPFESIYSADAGIGGEHDVAELSHST